MTSYLKKTIIMLMITTLSAGLLWSQSTFGPKTEKFIKIYESGTFQMKTTMRAGNESSEMEMYVKDNMIAMILTDGKDRVRIVQKDSKSYMIDDKERQIAITPVEQGTVQGIVDTEEIKFISSGSTNFNGKTYLYEEYISDADRLLFFVDGDRLIGIRTISAEVGTVDMIIHTFESVVPEHTFDVPAGYQIYDLSDLPENEDFLRLLGN